MLRAYYVGPTMDHSLAAYRRSHDARNHLTGHFRNLAELERLQPAPDVVIGRPLVATENGHEGSCAVHAIVPANTLVVALITSIGNATAQFVKHALEGRCHSRMLLHYPTPSLTADEVVARIDREARQVTPRVTTTSALPPQLLLRAASKDIGQIMTEDPRFARFIYMAATSDKWGTQSDLAKLLHVAEGTAKNLKSDLGKRLVAERCIPNDVRWTIGHFVRYITENRSFIQGFAPTHCPSALDPQVITAA